MKKARVVTHNTKKGFTLIEVIVSTALLVSLSTMAAAALLNVINADRKAQATRTIMDNLNFALENMSRNIRLGYEYNCSTVPAIVGANTNNTYVDCMPNTSTTYPFSFTAQDGTPVTYYFQPPQGTQNGKILLVNQTTGGPSSSPQPITSSDVNVQSFHIAYMQPTQNLARGHVIIFAQGTTGTGKSLTTFTIQTSVAER